MLPISRSGESGGKANTVSRESTKEGTSPSPGTKKRVGAKRRKRLTITTRYGYELYDNITLRKNILSIIAFVFAFATVRVIIDVTLDLLTRGANFTPSGALGVALIVTYTFLMFVLLVVLCCER